MDKTVIITIGLPGCGKSTTVKQNFPNIAIIERDIIRKEMVDNFTWSTWDWSLEPEINNIFNLIVDIFINTERTFICSDTNLRSDYRLKLANKLKNNNYNVFYLIFATTPDVCLKRDKERLYSVGEEVIYKLYNRDKKFVNTAVNEAIINDYKWHIIE